MSALLASCHQSKTNILAKLVGRLITRGIPDFLTPRWILNASRQETPAGGDVFPLSDNGSLGGGPGLSETEMFLPGQIIYFEEIESPQELSSIRIEGRRSIGSVASEHSRLNPTTIAPGSGGRTEYRPVWAKSRDFGEIQVSETMISTHIPTHTTELFTQLIREIGDSDANDEVLVCV